MRRKARSLGCKFARTIRDNPRGWEHAATMGIGQTSITNGTVTIVVAPCERCPCLQLLDHVRLYEIGKNGQLQHTPIGPVSRLCLRRAVRKWQQQRLADL